VKIEFIANRLDDILPTIREQHPFLAKQEIRLDISLIKQVRDLLEMTTLPDIKPLAFGFELKQIMACLEILCSDQHELILKKAYQVLTLRPKQQVMEKGWFKLVMNYPQRLLESAVREIAAVKGFEVFVSNDRISDNAPNWLVNEKLVQGIIRDYRQQVETSDLDQYLADNMIDKNSGLFLSTWRHLLTCGSLKELKREPEHLIIREFEDLRNVDHLTEFGAHYLNTLINKENWSKNILLLIQNRFGLPLSVDKNHNYETEFWKRVLDPVKSEFKQWYILYNIESFFEGERAEFWKQYVKAGEINNVKKILMGEGFLLDFIRFGVVEFKQVGNASYIYPRDVFQGYWNHPNFTHEWQLKDKEKTIRSVRFQHWDGRIIHSRNWKSDTAPKISALLRG